MAGPGNTTSDKHGRSGGVLADLCLGTKIIAGPGARWSLKDQGAKRVFLVTDSFFSEKGTALEIAQALGETYEIFDQVIPDPTAELVARGTARLKAFHPDLVVALGGGSPMDTAKAMVYFSGEQIPLAAIPHHLRFWSGGDGFCHCDP